MAVLSDEHISNKTVCFAATGKVLLRDDFIVLVFQVGWMKSWYGCSCVEIMEDYLRIISSDL